MTTGLLDFNIINNIIQHIPSIILIIIIVIYANLLFICFALQYICFLACEFGTIGKVFKVCKDREVYALKVVNADDCSTLTAEHATLQQLVNLRNTFLPTHVSEMHIAVDEEEEILGYGILLQPVGKWVLANKDQVSVEFVWNNALDALLNLHLLGIGHGDARLENLILLEDGTLVWFDFRESYSFHAVGMQLHDLRMCVRSVCLHYRKPNVPLPQHFVDQYKDDILKNNRTVTSPEWGAFKQSMWSAKFES